MKRLPCGRPAPGLPGDVRESAAAIAERLQRSRARLVDYLTAHGLKFSEQRWTIALRIFEARRHLSAGDIVREVQREDPGIGAATVYRNIKVLCEAKLLRETLVDADGRVVYEVFDDEHHDHIVCLDCGAIFEFHDDAIEERQAKMARDRHFAEVRHRHVIYARCEYRQSRR